MRMQQRSPVSKLYADGVAEDEQKDFRLEIQRLRDRVEALEGMLESQCVGTIGSAQAILEWMRSTRLPPPEAHNRAVVTE